MNKILLAFGTMFITIFLMGIISSAPIVTLNSPTDGSSIYINYVTLNFSTASSSALANYTLYDNSTGTWEERNISNFMNILGNETTDDGWTLQSAITQNTGLKITATLNSSILGVIKSASNTGTNCSILDSTYTLLSSTTFIGDTATFGTAVPLIEGRFYYIIVHKNGEAHNGVYKSLAHPKNIGGGITTEGFVYNLGALTDAYTLQSTNTGEIIAINTSVIGNNTPQTIINSYSSGSTILWNVKFCDILGICSFAPSNYTFSDGIYLNSNTFNSSTFETASEGFILDLTANSSLTDVRLVYDGTEYPMTNQGSGIWFKTLSITSDMVGSNSFNYKFTYQGSNYTSSNSTQVVNPLVFTLCNATYSTKFINYTFKDESTLSNINATIPTSTFNYWIGDSTLNKTYTFTNNTLNYDYAFCSNAVNSTVNVVPYIQYKQGTAYPQRVYQASTLALTNVTTNKILYLLGVADGIYVTFQVVNSADQVISGVNVVAEREISGSDVIIAQGTTGSDGSVTFWLNPDYAHTVTFTKTGYSSYITSITPTQSSYTITLGGGAVIQNSTFRGIDYSIVPTNGYLTNNTVYNFKFNLTSSYWDVSDYGFSIRLANGTILSGGNTGVEGTDLSFAYNTTNQTVIYLDYYWVINGNYTNASRYYVVQNSLYTGYSISNVFTDLSSYLDSGLFGLDNFGRYLIVYLILLISVGIMSYKYGISSPMALSMIVFGVIYFLDVVVGLIPDIRGIEHLLTYLSALIVSVTILQEVQR